MIHYVTGDATFPQGDGPKIIAHVCNNVGGWGRGFVLALSKRWNLPEISYRLMMKSSNSLKLGDVQRVHVEPDIQVCNMVAQAGYGTNNTNLHRTSEPDATPPIRYDSVRVCLRVVAHIAKTDLASVHMPRIGCGLAGGKWEEIEPIILETLGDVEVYVYDLPTKT
jgi:O-acetyl-ADP-ribose deacetylase (regulator of RNase III)